MSETLKFIEQEINEATEMVTCWRRQEEYDKALKYQAIKDKLIEVKTKYLEEHGEQNPIPSLCMATHPNQPNHSGHARGRKVHATINGSTTICNMMVDEYWKGKKINTFRPKCKICFK